MLPVDPTPPWLKLFTQALDPWDDEEDGDDGVRREACWLERRRGDIVVEVVKGRMGELEDELMIQ